MKAILTVIGKDKIGIVYKVSELLYKNDINILDFTQTIMDDNFVAMINVDLGKSKKNFDEISSDIEKLSKQTGFDIRLQNEEIFNKMSRI